MKCLFIFMSKYCNPNIFNVTSADRPFLSFLKENLAKTCVMIRLTIFGKRTEMPELNNKMHWQCLEVIKSPTTTGDNAISANFIIKRQILFQFFSIMHYVDSYIRTIKCRCSNTLLTNLEQIKYIRYVHLFIELVLSMHQYCIT